MKRTLLLTGMLVALAVGRPLSAYETVLDPDLAFVPPDAAAFVTIRPADLAGKIGPKEGLGQQAWAVYWQQHVGIPLDKIQRCTLVSPKDDASCSYLIVVTSKPYKRADVLKACVPDAKQVKLNGAVCQVSATTNTAVHFVNDRILILADTEKTLATCLAPPKASHPSGLPLTEALVQAGKHDIVLWCRAMPAPNCDVPPPQLVPPSAYGPVETHYGPPVSQSTIARKPKFDAPAEKNPPQGAKKEMITLGFVPLTFPAGVQSSTVVVDVGDKLSVELRVNCADKACAEQTEKVLRAMVKMARAMSLAAVAALDMNDALPEALPQSEFFYALPLRLISQIEKGFEDAHIRIEGKTVPVTVSIPIDAKTLRAEIPALLKMTDGMPCSVALPFLRTKTTLPSGHYLEHLPEYTPPAPVYPLQRELAAAPITPATMITPQLPPNGPTVLTPPMCPPPAPTPGIVAPTYTPPPAPMISPPIPPAIKLTVANVRKEPALLFTLGDNGKLTFVKKVPEGEAVDLQTTSGQRWVAVYPDNPASETFVANQAVETWLLRPDKNAPTTSGWNQPGLSY